MPADGQIQRLLSVQNAAARLVTGDALRRDHITPVLRQLHWLPVKQRIDFKLAVLVYKSLHGPAPPYLSDDCQLVADVGRRHLRSSDVYTCVVVPWTQSQIGDRRFSVAGLRIWNSLPTEIRRRLLKAFLADRIQTVALLVQCCVYLLSVCLSVVVCDVMYCG